MADSVLTAAASNPAVNTAISNASTAQQLLAGLSVISPALAKQIGGVALATAAGPWAGIAIMGASVLASKYGLNLDDNINTLVAVAAGAVGNFVNRQLATGKVVSVLPSSAPTLPTVTS